jgi:hypothetical protein
VDIFEVRQGVALPITVALMDDQGNPITSYVGTEALAASVWPGGNRPALFSPTAAWLVPGAGTISVLVTAAETATLAAGRYPGSLDLTDGSGAVLEAYRWAIDVLDAPGTGVAPPAYCGFDDLLDYGRAWLRTLQDEDDQAGFAEECGRARSWLNDLILAGWTASNSLTLGDPGYGAVLTGQGGRLPSVWLRQQLDAGALILRPQVVEICALKALSLICRSQIGPGDKGQDFARMGRIYGVEANELVKTLRAEIDTNQDGIPEFAVNLGESSMR